MSRAFVKEDDAGREPTIRVDGPRYLTAAGIARLRERIAELEAELQALSNDDPDYDRSRQALGQARAELDAAEELPPAGGDYVSVGTIVRLALADGGVQTVEIVGDDEIDPAHARIGRRSPLAAAIMNLVVGHHAVWHRPARDLVVTIESISSRG